jgi:hypothetical protein
MREKLYVGAHELFFAGCACNHNNNNNNNTLVINKLHVWSFLLVSGDKRKLGASVPQRRKGIREVLVGIVMRSCFYRC